MHRRAKKNSYPRNRTIFARNIRIRDAFKECEQVRIRVKMTGQFFEKFLRFHGFWQAPEEKMIAVLIWLQVTGACLKFKQIGLWLKPPGNVLYNQPCAIFWNCVSCKTLTQWQILSFCLDANSLTWLVIQWTSEFQTGSVFGRLHLSSDVLKSNGRLNPMQLRLVKALDRVWMRNLLLNWTKQNQTECCALWLFCEPKSSVLGHF